MYLDFSKTGEIKEMVHVGRTGSFVPVVDGGDLWRIKDDKKYTVAGTKSYKWIDRDVAFDRQKTDSLNIDMRYFEDLKQKAIDAIMHFDQEDDLCVFNFLEG